MSGPSATKDGCSRYYCREMIRPAPVRPTVPGERRPPQRRPKRCAADERMPRAYLATIRRPIMSRLLVLRTSRTWTSNSLTRGSRPPFTSRRSAFESRRGAVWFLFFILSLRFLFRVRTPGGSKQCAGAIVCYKNLDRIRGPTRAPPAQPTAMTRLPVCGSKSPPPEAGPRRRQPALGRSGAVPDRRIAISKLDARRAKRPPISAAKPPARALWPRVSVRSRGTILRARHRPLVASPQPAR